MLKRIVRWVALLALTAALLAGEAPLLAEEGRVSWSAPVNLSASGVASAPFLATGPGGVLQVFWWDDFDGLTTAFFDGVTWSPPQMTLLTTRSEPDAEGNVQVSTVPWRQRPLLIADFEGQVHAFWQAAVDTTRSDLRGILHTQLRLGTTTWAPATVITREALTFAVAPDPEGGLYIAYIRNQHTDLSPAGIYLRRFTTTWSEAVLLFTTRYFRSVKAEDVHLQLAAAEGGTVYAMWDDARLRRSMLVRSADRGVTWSAPLPLGDEQGGASWAQVFSGPVGQRLLLWQEQRGGCALYQQVSLDDGVTWTARERVLVGLSCGQMFGALRAPAGELFLVAGEGTSRLALAAWDGERWSEIRTLTFDFEDPQVARRIFLEQVRVRLVDDRLLVVGRGQDGDIWLLEGRLNALAWAFAPPSLWTEVSNISQSAGIPGLPASASDAEGRLHVLWAERPDPETPATALRYAVWREGRWSRPATVLVAPQGKAEEPALAVVGERLHALWTGNNGEIFYSRAFVRDANAQNAWRPAALVGPQLGSSTPVLVADLLGRLHGIYAVPLNEERGLYYIRSDDGGETWTSPQRIFDAVAARWARVLHPTLAVDEQGVIHVAWVRAPLPGYGAPEGLYYAASKDEGQSWTAPFVLAEGAFDWPQLQATYAGQVHVFWTELSGNRHRYHRWIEGETWTLPARVPGFERLTGPVGLAADGQGGLHLAALIADDVGQPAVLYTTWNGTRWGERELVRLERRLVPDALAGAALSLELPLGRLDLVFRALDLEAETPRAALFAMSRNIPPVLTLPAPAFAPPPTPTPTPGPTPTATPTPLPTVNPSPPVPSVPVLAVGPLLLPFTAVLGLGGALLLVMVAVLASSRRRR